MKIGDKVSVIDESLSGVITSVNNSVIVFRDEHGFTYQYSKDRLILQNASIYNNIIIEKKAEYVKPKSKKHSKKYLVLDLHFEKIVETPNQYGSFERLFIQKETLINTLDFCRKNNIKNLEIIHGIGDGILQKMVFEVLRSQTNIDFYNKEILHHQSGAVMVEIH